MGFEYSPYIIVLFSAAAICLAIGGYTWRLGSSQVEKGTIFTMMAAIAEWLVAAALGYATIDPSNKIIWAKIEYIGVSSVPLMVFIFSVNYSGFKHWLTTRHLILIAIVPVLTVLLAWTNELHGLIWSQYVPYQENGLMLSNKTYGLWFWVVWSYNYLLLLSATVLIIRAVLKSSNLFLGQAVSMTVAILVPWLGNAVYVLHISPLGNLDLTPLSFTITGIFLAIGVMRWHLFDIKPTAHTTVVENLVDGLILLNSQERVVDINTAAQNILGVRPTAIIGKQVSSILPFEFFPEELHYTDVKQNLAVNLIQNGKKKFYELTNIPFYNRNHARIGRIIMIHDATDYNLMQEALAHKQIEYERTIAEKKYRILFEQSKDPIFIATREGRFIDTNQSMLNLFGYTREEMLGMSISDLEAPETSEDILRLVKKIKEQGYDRFETQYIRKDGRIIDVEVSTNYLDIENGRLSVFVRDITERKRIEEEEQKLEKLESIGTLAGGIAHDFNNYLTSILGNIDLAKRYTEPEGKAYQRLEEAEKAGWLARDLTQQLLTFSRGGAPVKEASSLKELLEESSAFSLRGSEVWCDISLPDDLWSVEIDRGQINQVIHNLVKNADEAMPHGGVINISAKNIIIKAISDMALSAGKYIRISIKDQGTGIPEEYITRIFEPYFSTKQKGSGLGLATSYSIIKNHNGLITTESKLGIGTTFHIYLPASEKSLPTQKQFIEKKPVAGKGKILVMDDEDIIRDMLSNMLKLIGYKVELSQDGKEALKKYSEATKAGKPFDAIIMDLTIPGGMGGKETINNLLEVDPAAKVIVSSGYATDPIMADYKKYGFSAVITKPYNVGQMEKTLRDVLKRKS